MMKAYLHYVAPGYCLGAVCLDDIFCVCDSPLRNKVIQEDLHNLPFPELIGSIRIHISDGETLKFVRSKQYKKHAYTYAF